MAAVKKKKTTSAKLNSQVATGWRCDVHEESRDQLVKLNVQYTTISELLLDLKQQFEKSDRRIFKKLNDMRTDQRESEGRILVLISKSNERIQALEMDKASRDGATGADNKTNSAKFRSQDRLPKWVAVAVSFFAFALTIALAVSRCSNGVAQ